jgi:hypothetical protein
VSFADDDVAGFALADHRPAGLLREPIRERLRLVARL